MQIGRGQFEPVTISDNCDMKVDYFRYKDSLEEDIRNADLVVCHAGIATAVTVTFVPHSVVSTVTCISG